LVIVALVLIDDLSLGRRDEPLPLRFTALAAVALLNAAAAAAGRRRDAAHVRIKIRGSSGARRLGERVGERKKK
jgi:hypothetical protein